MKRDPEPLLVSIIIVSWNAREYLLQCLASLASSPCRYPTEIIVVDNASSDGSAGAVESAYPEVKVIRNSTNLGFAKANNIGIRESHGRYLCLLNSDIVVLNDCITRLVDYCEANPEVGMAGPHIIGRDGCTQRSCRGFPGLWNMFCRALALDTLFPGSTLFTGYSLSHWSHDDEREVDILSGCFWLARREAVDQVGLLDESFFMYGEDMDWCKRYQEAGWSLAFMPSAHAIHYGGASSANDPTRFYVEMQKANLQYWRKHRSQASTACYYLISCLHMLVRAAVYGAAFVLRPGRHPSYRGKSRRSLACLAYLAKRQPRVWPASCQTSS